MAHISTEPASTVTVQEQLQPVPAISGIWGAFVWGAGVWGSPMVLEDIVTSAEPSATVSSAVLAAY